MFFLSFCSDTANIWQTVGYFLSVFKIVIPILLVIMGMIDLGKAIVSNKEDQSKKSISSFATRIVAAILIFFLPTIISYIFDIVDPDLKWQDCKTCLVTPEKC